MTLRSSLNFLRSSSLRHMDQPQQQPHRQASSRNLNLGGDAIPSHDSTSLAYVEKRSRRGNDNDNDSDEECGGTVATVSTLATTCSSNTTCPVASQEDQQQVAKDSHEQQQQQQHQQQQRQQPQSPLERRGSKRNVLVESARESARFLRGLVKAHSARTLLSVLEKTTTEDGALNVKQQQQNNKDDEDTSNNTDAATNARITEKLQQELLQQGQGQDETECPHSENDDDDHDEAISLVPAPPQTPSKPGAATSTRNKLQRLQLRQKMPCLESLCEDEEGEQQDQQKQQQQQHQHDDKKKHVCFATNDDGTVQCQVRLVHLIEDKTDCWSSAHERQAFAENYTSVIDYYKQSHYDDHNNNDDDLSGNSKNDSNDSSNDQYKQSLRTLYNNAHRLSARETDAHLQTLALHSHARGLEGHIVKRGSVLRKRHLKAVLEAQAMWGWTRSTSHQGRCKFELQLYTISTKHSAKSRVLATAMAKLDTSEALISICSPWKPKPRRWSEAFRQVAAMSSSATMTITTTSAATTTSSSSNNSPSSNKPRRLSLTRTGASSCRNLVGNDNNPYNTNKSIANGHNNLYQYDKQEGTAATVIKPRPRQMGMTRTASTGSLFNDNNKHSSSATCNTATTTSAVPVNKPMRRMSLSRDSSSTTGGGSCRHLYNNNNDDNNPATTMSLPKRQSSLTRGGAATATATSRGGPSSPCTSNSQRNLMVNHRSSSSSSSSSNNNNNCRKKLDPLANNSNHNKNKNSKNMQPCKPTRQMSFRGTAGAGSSPTRAMNVC